MASAPLQPLENGLPEGADVELSQIPAANGVEGQAINGSGVFDQSAPAPAEARPARFSRPPEPDYNLAPAEHLEIRNSNIPLTIGLLFSVIAAFLVFFVSMAGGTAGEDPVLPSFWRSLSALAVFTTLSFVASWFMPAPSERRLQLQKLEQENADPFGDRDFEAAAPEEAPPAEPLGAAEDLTLADEIDEYDEDEDEEYQTETANMAGATSPQAAAGPGR